jgi:hypothetical protein
MGGEATAAGESGLLVDVIALIDTIPVRTFSRGATCDAYNAAANTATSGFGGSFMAIPSSTP